jgi:hypothetical protein
MVTVSRQLFEKICVVVELGYNVLVLEEDVFIYTSFEASTSSNVSSIDFCSVTCICVSDFMLNTQISELINKVQFKSKLIQKIDSLKMIKMNFNKQMAYYTFAS